ncbi:homeobox transcription [Phlyctema vagabunda]|uniref:Homeobox transcription n=1 Tax=Phlyctema vagabunda TaxID=108571 RepID=A0ABR4PQN0_9HELO
MLDGDDGGVPQTAAERRAERRKMKRFRLTHQQTRFLMSEFAKQAHPDAAHRERLSREIPGLSPRQVQVWFQNRRAKIKRLTVDDRERMMKMRAVPDDFDNVQALHSPYGAVHGIGTPMQSPVDFVSGYADPMMRPLMVDTMRRHHESEDHMSPNGLSPAYGHMGFAPPGSMGTPDILSPLSLNSNDRYYSSHVSSPMSAGPRSANMFPRQTSTDNYQALSNSRQHVRSLQPLQVRTTMSRSRSESLQSPLRSSMSWKGENLDYGFTQTGQPSPQLSGRQASAYQGEHMGNNGIHASQYDPIAYSNANAQNSHGHMTYSTSHTSPSSLSRLRSSSSAFPPGLDLRNQYRTLPSQQQHHPSQHGMPPTPRSAAFNNAFSAGFASAPLSAPVDFNLPRTPGEPSAGTRDFSMPQLSAPMAPPQDFTNAYSSPLRAQHSDRDYHTSSLGHNSSPGSRMGDHKSPQHNEDSNFLRPSHDYEMGHKRKRSFTLPGAYETTP